MGRRARLALPLMMICSVCLTAWSSGWLDHSFRFFSLLCESTRSYVHYIAGHIHISLTIKLQPVWRAPQDFHKSGPHTNLFGFHTYGTSKRSPPIHGGGNRMGPNHIQCPLPRLFGCIFDTFYEAVANIQHYHPHSNTALYSHRMLYQAGIYSGTFLWVNDACLSGEFQDAAKFVFLFLCFVSVCVESGCTGLPCCSEQELTESVFMNKQKLPLVCHFNLSSSGCDASVYSLALNVEAIN